MRQAVTERKKTTRKEHVDRTRVARKTAKMPKLGKTHARARSTRAKV